MIRDVINRSIGYVRCFEPFNDGESVERVLGDAPSAENRVWLAGVMRSYDANLSW